jgi:hypothetical protein
MSISKVLALVLMVCGGSAIANTIGPDCAPSGLINVAKETISSTPFWKGALIEIDQEVAAVYTAGRVSQIQDQKDKAAAAFEEREARAMRVPQIALDPASQRELAAIEREIAAFWPREIQRVQQWATKCRAYANQKLSERH